MNNTKVKDTYGLQVVRIRLVREATLYEDQKITSPDDAVKIMARELADLDREMVCILNLNTKGAVLNMNVVSMGTINLSIVSPREIFKSSILSNAAAMIMVHNHPSGDTTPSTEDVRLTDRIRDCGKLLDIPLLDHVIISGEEKMPAYSFREHGLLEREVDRSDSR